jgi:hypothetical protein
MTESLKPGSRACTKILSGRSIASIGTFNRATNNTNKVIKMNGTLLTFLSVSARDGVSLRSCASFRP